MKYVTQVGNHSIHNWLGELPHGWATKRLKYVSTINDETLPETTDPDYEMLYVDIGSVDATVGIQKKELMIFEAAPSRARRVVKDGDTIVSTVRTYLRAVAPINDPEKNLIVSTGFAVVRPKDIDQHYLAYCLRSSYFIETIVSRSVGVSYPATNPTDVSCIELSLPPVDKQQTIARFLDAKTAQIDLLIAQKQKLIDKLKEKRSALIARTVTRGLPPEAAKAAGLEPNPEMKDSGVEWIGDIPRHWNAAPYKRLCSRVDVGIAEAATHAYCDDGVPIIRSKNVKPEGLDTSDLIYIEPWFAEKNKSKVLRTGDLITVRTGYPGTTAVIPTSLDGCQCFTLVMSSVLGGVHSPFIVYFFNSVGMRYFEVEAWGSAQANISVPIVQYLSVAVPPMNEQRAIVAYLDRETTQLDVLTAKIETAIARFTEYRQALITSAVTGKIDVRSFQDDN